METRPETIPIDDGDEPLAGLVTRAHENRERFVLTRSGEPMAAIISLEEFQEYQRLRDEADLALAQSRHESATRWIPHDDVMAILEADEREADEAGR